MSIFTKFFPQMTSIRSRLVLLVLLSLVPVALVLIYSALENRRITGEQAVDNLANIVELIHSDFEDAINASSQLLTSLALTPEKWLETSTECNQQLATLNKQFASYSNIYSVDINGQVICSAINQTTTINLQDRRYIKDTLESAAIVVGHPVEGRFSDQKVIPIALPLCSAEGEIVGALALSINLTQFLTQNIQTHAINSKSLNNVTATLWQTDGTVLVRSPDPLSMNGQQARESELFQTLESNITSRRTMEVRGLDQI